MAAAEDNARQQVETEALRKAQEDVATQEDNAPQTEDPPHSTTETYENLEENEDEEDLSVANVLPDDAEIS